eukprot:CAMPEP_0184724320 /NCGR_PEP_ID=MMETSP0314-20130426/27599_1 /TAXON_ID=38298 /ORGANISM="Rhodella maculata, Strain CCMP 736" /LENGTH=81 /DNA_ID=CAMNT_0027189295 /DNA_START=1 /DNA_END=243 /DNA_ORIENTATION=+
MTLTMNAFGEVCGVYMPGRTSVDPAIIMKCAKLAAERAKAVVEQIQKAVEAAGPVVSEGLLLEGVSVDLSGLEENADAAMA